MNVINYLRQVNGGSAVAEFLIFTLPFFIIFLVLITTVQGRSMAVSRGNRVTATISVGLKDKASASEYVDLWR